MDLGLLPRFPSEGEQYRTTICWRGCALSVEGTTGICPFAFAAGNFERFRLGGLVDSNGGSVPVLHTDGSQGY